MGDGRYVRSVERIRPQLVHVYWTYVEPRTAMSQTGGDELDPEKNFLRKSTHMTQIDDSISTYD